MTFFAKEWLKIFRMTPIPKRTKLIRWKNVKKNRGLIDVSNFDLLSGTSFLSITREKMDNQYTCESILKTLKGMNFAELQGQGFMPLYKREKFTNDLHDACGFRTDYQFITKSQMKTIQKKSKNKE